MILLALVFNAVFITASSALLESEQISSSTLLQLISNEQSMRLQLQTQLHQLQGQVQAHQSQIVNNTAAINNNKQQVAFSVKLRQKLPMSAGSVVKFDDVITNIGNAYSQATGVFRCPISGLYLFSLNILTDTKGLITADVVQNGNRIAGTGNYDSGSDTVLVRVKVGDEILVTNMGGSSAYIDKSSLFVGVLLKAD